MLRVACLPFPKKGGGVFFQVERTKAFQFCLLALSAVGMLWAPAGALTASGITYPLNRSTISAMAPGRVAVLPFKEGQYVKKGDIIVLFENDEETIEAQRRKLIWENKVELQAAEQQAATLKKDFEATQKLYQSTGSISEEEMWQKDLEYKKALAEVGRVTLAEKREELEYQLAEAGLAKKAVRAPYNCVIVKIHYNLGESCNALEPLVDVVNVSQCRFVTYIEARATQSLQKNQKVTLTIEGGKTSIRKEGTIDFISPVVDPASGLREIKVLFGNQDQAVQPGVNGTLEIPGI